MILASTLSAAQTTELYLPCAETWFIIAVNIWLNLHVRLQITLLQQTTLLAMCSNILFVTVRRSRLTLRGEGVAGWWGETTIINNPHGPATSHPQRDRWDSQKPPT